MENNKKENNFLLGILGALIGALIASIPWVLAYVYANMILSILALPVAIGALIGYQKFKGTVNGKLPITITITSLLVISFATLVAIPLLLLKKDGYLVSFSNLELLYANTEFKAALLKDYAISIAFTLLGISGVIKNIKNQLSENSELTEIKLNRK